jgi:hypothetical protein
MLKSGCAVLSRYEIWGLNLHIGVGVYPKLSLANHLEALKRLGMLCVNPCEKIVQEYAKTC